MDHVNQFPSDAELTRYVHTLSDADLVKKCQRCMEAIIRAKERQAEKAHKNADILLKEIDDEKVRIHFLNVHCLSAQHCLV